jgi:putative transposase
MGIAAIYRKRNTSAPHPAHPVYPYLLKGLTIDRPNHVLGDRHHLHPDEAGLRLSGRHSRLGHAQGAGASGVDQHEHGLLRRGAGRSDCQVRSPEIFNTDQGSQFTSADFTRVLKDNGIQISMDGKGRWVDNVFVERLWRSVKYEHVYLHAYESVAEAREQLAGTSPSTTRNGRILRSAADAGCGILRFNGSFKLAA